eukprot:1159439-Pelagomonas_calceolata.AAC.4
MPGPCPQYLQRRAGPPASVPWPYCCCWGVAGSARCPGGRVACVSPCRVATGAPALMQTWRPPAARVTPKPLQNDGAL